MSSEINVNDLVSIDPNKLHAHMNPSRRISIKIPTSSTPSNLNIVAKAVNRNLKVKQAPPQRQVKPDFNQSHRTPSPKFLLHSQTCLNLILKLISLSPPTYQLDQHRCRSQPDTGEASSLCFRTPKTISTSCSFLLFFPTGGGSMGFFQLGEPQRERL